jgi:hypothetical protein
VLVLLWLPTVRDQYGCCQRCCPEVWWHDLPSLITLEHIDVVFAAMNGTRTDVLLHSQVGVDNPRASGGATTGPATFERLVLMEQVSAIRGHHIRCDALAGPRSFNGVPWTIYSFIHSLFLSFFLSFLLSVSFYYFVALNVFQRRTIHTNSQRVLEVGFLPKRKKLVWHILRKYPGTRIKNTEMNLCRKTSRLIDWCAHSSVSDIHSDKSQGHTPLNLDVCFQFR